MKSFIVSIATIMSAIANALPTFPSSTLELRGDGRAATLFKHPDLCVINNDSTFVPASSYCTNTSNIFGGFDGQVKSLSVEKGFKCNFYAEAGCGINDLVTGGAVLEVGSRDKQDVRKQLGSWEGKIASISCQRL